MLKSENGSATKKMDNRSEIMHVFNIL